MRERREKMIKQFSVLALAGMIALPALASAGVGKAPSDINNKIDELSRQLESLKAQLAQQNETISEYGDKVDDIDDMLEEKSPAWDLAARFKFYGDFRARMDYYSATGADYMSMTTGQVVGGSDYSNDTMFTNRFRLNMRVKATENVEFKGRLAMYKAWGMESYARNDLNTWWPQFDGNSTRTPSDNALRVDRAFVNWNNIGGAPIWFSIGRRPTTDGPPAQIRLGTDQRMATPVAYMDYPFDGISMGYAYAWGSEAMGSGRIRFCYGRGFESGLQLDTATNPYPTDDTDFMGLSWDVMKKGDRFLNIQSFAVINMFNYPNFQDPIIDAMAADAFGMENSTEGNIYHTSAVYQDKVANFTYFIAGGWSQTDPGGKGMFNDYATSMIPQADGTFLRNPQWKPNTNSEDGFSVYAGIRYDLPNVGLKFGAEYNYGSEYWIAFTPGHDDMYLSKLSTRGQVAELYMIYDLPTGEAISKYAKTFLRLGYQHYWYDYTGVDWNMKPYDTDDAALMTAAYMMASESGGLMPVESADQVYLTMDVFF
jgi:hypothetical protein